MKSIKLFFWKFIYGFCYRILYIFSYKLRHKFNMFTSEDTLKYIIKTNCSVARFGDGEFQMIEHYYRHGTLESFKVDTFQNYSPKLAKRLCEVLDSCSPYLLVCIPYAFIDSSIYKGYERIFFEREWLYRKKMLVSFPNLYNHLLGDASFTRFYMGRADIKDKNKYVSLLKTLWENRNILIVEGEQSRLGVGNDLFDNTETISRVICPSVNAFSKYKQILSSVLKYSADKLVLIALGHTATILAFDLAKRGVQALDIGHVDVEYEWMKMGATHKVPICNKYVNEVSEGRIHTAIDDITYTSSILEVI